MLKDLKESNSVKIAEYVTARGIQDEPAFVWWVPYTPRKKDRAIAAVQSRVRKSTHKYGIEAPTSTKHALEIDRQNGNTLWQNALKLEMANVSVAFKILGNNEHVPPGYRKSSGHIIWDLKIDFAHKTRWAKDDHRTPDPESSFLQACFACNC